MEQILNFSHLLLYLRFLINLRLFRFAVHRGSLFLSALVFKPHQFWLTTSSPLHPRFLAHPRCATSDPPARWRIHWR
jgi:hypothetical protein